MLSAGAALWYLCLVTNDATARRTSRCLRFDTLRCGSLVLASILAVGCIPDSLQLAETDAGAPAKDATAPNNDAAGDGSSDAVHEAVADTAVEEALPPCTGNCPVVLASGLKEPMGIVVSDGRVYWTEFGSGKVLSCATSGCGSQPETLAEGQGGPTDVATYSSDLYWTNATSGELMKCSIPDCAKSGPIATGQGGPTGLDVAQTMVMWTNESSGELMYHYQFLPSSDTAASGQKRPVNVLQSGSTVFWLNQGAFPQAKDGEVRKGTWSQSGLVQGDPLAEGQDGPSGLALRKGTLFWSNLGASQNAGEIWSCSANDWHPDSSLVASGQAEPRNITVDGEAVYWTNAGSGQVMACALNGCGNKPTVLASGGSRPWGITSDADSIYWTDRGSGQVLKLAK